MPSELSGACRSIPHDLSLAQRPYWRYPAYQHLELVIRKRRYDRCLCLARSKMLRKSEPGTNTSIRNQDTSSKASLVFSTSLHEEKPRSTISLPSSVFPALRATCPGPYLPLATHCMSSPIRRTSGAALQGLVLRSFAQMAGRFGNKAVGVQLVLSRWVFVTLSRYCGRCSIEQSCALLAKSLLLASQTITERQPPSRLRLLLIDPV